MSTQWSDNLETTSVGNVRMIRCPVCDKPLTDSGRASHFRNEHSPSDFGMSSLGDAEVPADD